jgi:hypothetical protein
MLSLHYFAAWTDSHCLVGCDHHHETIISAVACCKTAGAYVVAVERGQLRAVHLGTAVRFDPRDVAGLITRFKCAPASSAMDDLIGPRVRSTRAVPASTSFRDRVRSRD